MNGYSHPNYRNINEVASKDNVYFVGTDDRELLYAELTFGEDRMRVDFWKIREAGHEVMERIPDYCAKGIINNIKRKNLPLYFNAEAWMNVS